MKIVIDPFDKKSISEAIREVKEYRQEFEAKEQEFVRRVAELGVSVASSGFALADYDSVNDVQMTMTQSGASAVVTAFGETGLSNSVQV